MGGIRLRPRGSLGWLGLASAVAAVAWGGLAPLLQEAAGRLLGAMWGPWVLEGVLVALAVALWLWSRRDAGFGVVLRVTERTVRSAQRQATAEAQAERGGRWIAVEKDLPPDPVRRDKALDDVHSELQARLNKQAGEAGRTPVSLYLIAYLPDAFGLGRRVKYDLHRRLTVMQAEDAAERPLPFYPAVRLGGHLQRPMRGWERRRTERFLRSHVVELDPDAPADQLALVVAFVPTVGAASAIEAARTGSSGEYVVSAEDRCRAVLVVEAAGNGLPQKRAAFERAVRYVCDEWSRWLAGCGGVSAPLLFLSVPASVAMALGFVFARTPVRFVGHIRPGS